MTEQLRPFEVVDLKSSTALKVMTDLADLKGGDKKLDTVIASNCTAIVVCIVLFLATYTISNKLIIALGLAFSLLGLFLSLISIVSRN
jgi:hypothetical protein